MDVNECIVTQRLRDGANNGRVHSLHLADRDPARQRPAIPMDRDVGHFGVVVKAVEEDTATALRTIGEGYAIDARWVAKEVAPVEW